MFVSQQVGFHVGGSSNHWELSQSLDEWSSKSLECWKETIQIKIKEWYSTFSVRPIPVPFSSFSYSFKGIILFFWVYFSLRRNSWFDGERPCFTNTQGALMSSAFIYPKVYFIFSFSFLIIPCYCSPSQWSWDLEF